MYFCLNSMHSNVKHTSMSINICWNKSSEFGSRTTLCIWHNNASNYKSLWRIVLHRGARKYGQNISHFTSFGAFSTEISVGFEYHRRQNAPISTKNSEMGKLINTKRMPNGSQKALEPLYHLNTDIIDGKLSALQWSTDFIVWWFSTNSVGHTTFNTRWWTWCMSQVIGSINFENQYVCSITKRCIRRKFGKKKSPDIGNRKTAIDRSTQCIASPTINLI